MRILVLGGAGLMASGTIRDLLSERSSDVRSVLAVDSDPRRLSRLHDAIRDPRLETRIADIANLSELLRLLADCDLCVNGVPTFAGLQMSIFGACLEARRTYVDYGGMGVFTARQKAEHARWQAAGVTAVLGLGADPGLSNILCRTVADRLETIDRIHLYWAAAKIGPDSPVLIPPYNITTLLAEFANPSRQFFDGRLVEMPAQSGAETIALPEPWGLTTFIHSQHSEPLTVPFARGIADKGIREFTWKLALPRAEHSGWAALTRAGFDASGEPVLVRGVSVNPVEVLQAVIDRNIERHADRHNGVLPQPESHEMHFANGYGTLNGNPCRVTARVIGGPDPLYEGYVDAGTSMNMSIGVQQILRRPPAPGVWAPEECFDPAEYLAEVSKRRFRVEIEMETIERL